MAFSPVTCHTRHVTTKTNTSKRAARKTGAITEARYLDEVNAAA